MNAAVARIDSLARRVDVARSTRGGIHFHIKKINVRIDYAGARTKLGGVEAGADASRSFRSLPALFWAATRVPFDALRGDEDDVMKRVTTPSSCPACGHGLDVLRLGCAACGTAIEGRYGLGKLGQLNKAQLEFVEVFLECRGKIKDVEQQLGISYPTVVARLDEAVLAMKPRPEVDPEPRPKGDRARQADVLGALERGEITAAEAAARLRIQRGGGT
jgi:hypothetical protein